MNKWGYKDLLSTITATGRLDKNGFYSRNELQGSDGAYESLSKTREGPQGRKTKQNKNAEEMLASDTFISRKR